MLPTCINGDDSGLLDDVDLVDPTNHSPALSKSLFDNGIVETPTNTRVGVNEAAAALTNLASFPSSFGMLQNWFTNQNSEFNNEGYNSKGNLPHFADSHINNNMEEYNEDYIEGGGRRQRQWWRRWHRWRWCPRM